MSRREAGPPGGLEAYLLRLEAELAGVPAAERREILLETRSHVLERTGRSPSRGVEEVLAELGPPGEYARQFLPDVEAEPLPRPGTLGGLARLATGRWTALPLLMLVVFAYAVALFTFLFAVSKLIEPDATGVYTSDAQGRRGFMIVWSDPHHGGHEVLGLWLVPIGLLISLGIHLLVSALLRRVLRSDARRS